MNYFEKLLRGNTIPILFDDAKGQSTDSTNVKVKVIWDKVFKNGQSKICGRQPLKNLKRYGMLIPSNLLKAVFSKFYLVHS